MSKPVVKIQTLEDSPSWLDRRLVLAYIHTTYRLLLPAYDLRIGQFNAAFDAWLQGQNAGTFAFITASNPYSQWLAQEENQRRNTLLEDHLRALSLSPLPACAAGDDQSWAPEPGFFTLGIEPEQAVEAGRAFEQNAIVFAERGKMPELWWIVQNHW